VGGPVPGSVSEPNLWILAFLQLPLERVAEARGGLLEELTLEAATQGRDQMCCILVKCHVAVRQ
jgi:hypothetical protein